MAETVGASAAAVPARNAAESAKESAKEGVMSASDPVPYLAETQRAGFGAVLASTEPQPNSASNSRAAAQKVSADRSASPEDAFARKDPDLKRSAAERRRAERHQRWAERHRRGWRAQGEWSDVDRRAREDAYSRDNARPAYGSPQIRLFGDDD